jgi:23S rRNA (adenine2030-N6)-methyltransferase
MLSYQHAYHAGNMADVHKHAALAWALDYLTRKPKPLSYLETHAGRALYDLGSDEALKTGEAAQGILRIGDRLPTDHPYARAIAAARKAGGPMAYPGSPFIARTLLRPGDRITLAELHPREVEALRAALPEVDVRQEDGPKLALSMTPLEPRRGLCLIDPSYELKQEYTQMPRLVSSLLRRWNVGVLMLWYPVLESGAQTEMQVALDALAIEGALHHTVRFPPARAGHGMTGSGLFVVNPPWGMAEDMARIAKLIAG